MITLTNGADALELPIDLQWIDELTWQPVEQFTERTLTGALVVMDAAKVGGRPITLAPEDERSAWFDRAMVDQLREWTKTPGLAMTLDWHGTAYQVAFRHADTALEARPVVHFAGAPLATDYYLATVRLMEI